MTEPPKASARKKNRYHHGDLRAHLVAATRRLVEQRGPDAFSVSEACRLAGVSTAAPYRHFSDKQDLLTAVAADGMRRLGDAMQAALEAKRGGTVDAIAAIGVVYVNFAIAEPSVFRLMFGLTQHHRKSQEIVEAGRRAFGILLGEVAAFDGKQQIDEETVRRGFALWTVVHGMSFLHIDAKVNVVDFPVVIDDLVFEMTRKLLRP